MKNRNVEMFIKNLSEKLKKFSIKNIETINSQFDKLMLILDSVVNKHIPFTRVSRREKRLQNNTVNSTVSNIYLKNKQNYANLKQIYTEINFKEYTKFIVTF